MAEMHKNLNSVSQDDKVKTVLEEWLCKSQATVHLGIQV